MYGQERWMPLDLRRRATLGPFDGELIVLRRTSRDDWHTVRHDVGRLKTEAGKTWFEVDHGGIYAPADLRKKYDLHWCHLPGDDKI